MRKVSGLAAVPDEGSFGFGRAPGFVGDSTECEARGLDGVAVDLESGGDGDEGEGVALAVADLEVVGVLCEFAAPEVRRR